jgi:FADH2-dependent halogenase
MLLEKEEFPRFHIGESLLPYMAGLLEQLGIWDVVASQGYVDKFGSEFIDATETRFFSGVFRADFSKQSGGRHSCTFQVERSEFDRLLLEQAVVAGARVLQGADVTDLLMDGDRMVGVRYRHGDQVHEEHCSYVIDASGRAGKIANRFGLRKKSDKSQMIAVFRHYCGLNESYNLGHEGDIQVGVHDDGWVWAIPLSKTHISVGTVMPGEVLRRTTPKRAFDEHWSRVPKITNRLTGTRPIMDLKIEINYPHHSDTVTGPGWLMVGDAAGFGDPIFSGGVLVASVTGARAGRTVADALDKPEKADRLIADHADFYKTGYDTYTRLIQAFYEGELVAVAAGSTEREALPTYMNRLIGGDFWSEHNPISEEMRRRKEWDTFAPFPRSLGCPVYPQFDDYDRKALAEARKTLADSRRTRKRPPAE